MEQKHPPKHPGPDCNCAMCREDRGPPDHPAQHTLIIAFCDALDAVRDLMHVEDELPHYIECDLPHMKWLLEFCEGMIAGATRYNKAVKARKNLLEEREEQRQREVKAREATEEAAELTQEILVLANNAVVAQAPSVRMTPAVAPPIPVFAGKKNYWEAD